MEKLFDPDIKREGEGPATYKEARFTYLNRTGRELFADARGRVEKWYEAYISLHPEEAKEMKSRFTSTDDKSHLSALTELYVHNFLLENGYMVVVHPELEHTTARPDFLAVKDHHPCFYVEVATVIGSKEQGRLERFKAEILDAVDEISSPDFLISPNFKQTDSDAQPSTASVKKELVKWLGELDYEKVCKDYERDRKAGFPTYRWKQNSWMVDFMATPVKDEKREERKSTKSRNIGATFNGVREVTLGNDIRIAVKAKVDKYGLLGLPFLVAINVIADTFFCDDDTILTALFGPQTISMLTFPDGRQSTEVGRKNGLLCNPRQIKCTRLSALMVIPGLEVQTVRNVEPKIWHHFAPRHILGDHMLKVKQMKLNKTTSTMEELK